MRSRISCRDKYEAKNYLFFHSNFAHAYFAVMTDKIISRILASARTGTSIIIHGFMWLEKFYFFFPFLKFSQALMVFSPFSLPWM